MTKAFAIALALTGAVWLGASASANAATKIDGLSNTAAQTAVATEDMSARRRYRRVVRYYDPPRYYGYYGPTYYERPYARPRAPFFFWPGGYY